VNVAIAAGVVLGILYTLSPLTVLCVAIVGAVAWLIARPMSPRERAWFLGLAGAAMALRLVVIAALFIFSDASRPYATFFGDEELFKNESVWLRNIHQGVPVSPADMIYTFDDVGRSNFIYLLAFIQALVGDAPYGINVLHAAWYMTGVLLLHALIRRSFGSVAALGASLALLFLPSLFSWSISVLKEPLYILIAMVELICATQIVRAPSWPWRIAAIAGVLVCGATLETVRQGGWLLAIVGTTAGLAGAVVVPRPRVLLASIAALMVFVSVAATQPAIRHQVVQRIEQASDLHWGHILTPGYTYDLLDPEIYVYGNRYQDYVMTAGQAARYVIRAAVSFVTVPRPSQIGSRAALAYLPEQAVWYVIVVLFPVGVVAGFRRDPLVTSLLVAHGLAAAAMVALTGGNIGTLIRHRGLALPYFISVAMVGACYLLARPVRPATARQIEPLYPRGEHA
jgi:hypothetical protein